MWRAGAGCSLQERRAGEDRTGGGKQCGVTAADPGDRLHIWGRRADSALEATGSSPLQMHNERSHHQRVLRFLRKESRNFWHPHLISKDMMVGSLHKCAQ